MPWSAAAAKPALRSSRITDTPDQPPWRTSTDASFEALSTATTSRAPISCFVSELRRDGSWWAAFHETTTTLSRGPFGSTVRALRPGGLLKRRLVSAPPPRLHRRNALHRRSDDRH